MYKNLLVITIATVLLVLGACSKAPQKIQILTENYPPLSFEQNGEITGFGSDVVNAIQAELGTKHAIRIMDWDDAYATALRESNVILFTMDKTPEREDKFHFIGPLGSNVASFYANRDNMTVPVDIEQAKSYSSIATTTDWFTEQYLKEEGFENLSSNADPLQAVKLLADQKADLAVFTDVTLPELCKEAGVDIDSFTPVLELLSTDYYIAISKTTDVKTVEDWQKAFATIKERGELAKLHSKWFD
jgi:polar amino acid transport system substrate-binding protein